MLMSLGFILSTPLKGFMQASNIIRLAPRKLMLKFKDILGKKTVFSNVKCYKSHIFSASSSESALLGFPNPGFLKPWLRNDQMRKGITEPLSWLLFGPSTWGLTVIF